MRRFLAIGGATVLSLTLAAAAAFHLRPPFIQDAKALPGLVFALLAAVLLLLLIVFRQHRRLRQQIRESGRGQARSGPNSPRALNAWLTRHVAPSSLTHTEERDHIDAIFDLLQDGVLLLDGENRILRANATAAILLGDRPETLLGRPLADLADQASMAALVDEIRATGAYQSTEMQLQSISALCSAAGIPLHDDLRAGSSHVMLVLRDLTRLRQLERAGEDYATNVSHELKTPLTLILGHTETLISHADMEPEFRNHALLTIERHAKRILRIIDDLLRLAWLRDEAGTVGIPRAPVTVGPLVDEAVGTCREWARAAGIDIETCIPGDLVWSLNSGLIEEAIVNLVKNAILYALAGPVEVRARVLESGPLEFTVTDRGPGLKPEDAKRIFDRFYRVDKGRARSAGGSGLGLPIVQQIVEAHGGSARVETTPGEGCTFILEIPSA